MRVDLSSGHMDRLPVWLDTQQRNNNRMSKFVNIEGYLINTDHVSYVESPTFGGGPDPYRVSLVFSCGARLDWRYSEDYAKKLYSDIVDALKKEQS